MPDIVLLNVGGKHFDTTRATLSPSEYFRAQFAFWDRAEIPQDVRHFVDRDGKNFRQVLALLRDPNHNFPAYLEYELEFYGIEFSQEDKEDEKKENCWQPTRFCGYDEMRLRDLYSRLFDNIDINSNVDRSPSVGMNGTVITLVANESTQREGVYKDYSPWIPKNQIPKKTTAVIQTREEKPLNSYFNYSPINNASQVSCVYLRQENGNYYYTDLPRAGDFITDVWVEFILDKKELAKEISREKSLGWKNLRYRLFEEAIVSSTCDTFDRLHANHLKCLDILDDNRI